MKLLPTFTTEGSALALDFMYKNVKRYTDLKGGRPVDYDIEDIWWEDKYKAGDQAYFENDKNYIRMPYETP